MKGKWTDGHVHGWMDRWTCPRVDGQMDMSMVDGQMKDRQPLKFVADDGTNKNFFFFTKSLLLPRDGSEWGPSAPLWMSLYCRERSHCYIVCVRYSTAEAEHHVQHQSLRTFLE